MIYENEKIWFQLKRLWRLFGFVVLIFFCLFYLCQVDMFYYITHKNDFEVIEAEIINLDMTEENVLRGKKYSYYVEAKELGNDGRIYRIFRDVNDFVGKRVKVAINKNNRDDVYRPEWIRPKDGIWVLTCGMGGFCFLLFVGKILSYFKLKRVFNRIDNEYMPEVSKKRLYSVGVNVSEMDAIITKIKRDANAMITMETTQIYCRLQKSNEVVRSPKILGHTFLKEGDHIRLDDGIEIENDINWAQFFI